MAHTDAHRKLTTWTHPRDLRHFAKDPAEKAFARLQSGRFRAAERAACVDARKGGEDWEDLDTRHRHGAGWMVS